MPTTAATPAGPDRRSIALGMLTLYLVWGSTYLAIAIAVDTIPPFLMAAARFLLAGVVMLGWTVVRGSFRWPSRREWRDTSIVGALLLGGGMGMVSFGEQTIPSGVTALIVSMMPIWVAVFGRLIFGERLPWLAGIGIVIGFGGIGVLVGPTALGAEGALDALGVAAVLVSPISWTLGSLFAQHRASLPADPLMNTGTQMTMGGLVLLTMAVLTGEPARFDPTAVAGASILGFVYLAVVGSLLAFTVYGWMLRVAPLPLVATYAYVNPIVAVILGALILQEPVDARTVVAGAIVVTAVALIVTARGRMQAPRRPAVAVTPPPAPSGRPAAPAPSRSASD